MKFTTENLGEAARKTAARGLAKRLFEAIVDADLFDESLRVILKRRHHTDDDHTLRWWSIDVVKRRGFRTEGNRMQLVKISESGTVSRVREGLQELVHRAGKSYYLGLAESSQRHKSN